MEARVDMLEKEVQEIREQVGNMDSKVGALTAKVDGVEGQLGAITEFMKEIRNMMKTNSPGQKTNAGTSSPGDREVQSALPRGRSTPRVEEDSGRGKSVIPETGVKGWEKAPEWVETSATVALSREEVYNR